LVELSLVNSHLPLALWQSLFISKDFKPSIRICGMTYVRTLPYYLQSNVMLKRYHRTIKGECIRLGTPLSLSGARRLVTN